MGRPDLTTQIGGLKLSTPIIAASGCFGYGVEYSDLIDLSTLGGISVKGLFLEPREGHPPARIIETPSGMLNAIGLQGIGVRQFIEEKLPLLRDKHAVVIVNICGSSVSGIFGRGPRRSSREVSYSLVRARRCSRLEASESGIFFHQKRKCRLGR